MRFRFYITNPYSGCVHGTDDPETAKEYAADEDFFVIDSETGEWLLEDATSRPIEDIACPTDSTE